ncbi:MAG: TrkA family potassium uptake protein [Desulfovibrionaceae bacterium]|nr:TrkA family potassium uptake protein [Desulfovibrionaceae bacterium]MDD4951785.1 TrkA family potassium uptake protein [Desulfovibrionaceae bacterium]
MTKKQRLFFIVTGCGRLGSVLAEDLSAAGHEVVVMDKDAEALNRLSDRFGGKTVEGDATETSALRHCGAEKADALIAVTGDPNVNLMAAQVAKKVFGLATAVAVVQDPERLATYRDTGIIAVCPALVAEASILAALGLPGPKAGENP